MPISQSAIQASVLVERIGAVMRISHNRPNVGNAENTTLLDEMDAALDEALADHTVGAIIIGGVGKNFSAGHDVKEAMAERGAFTVEQRWEYEAKRYFGYALKIFDAPKPTIAQIQGACLGGAFMVANMCDLVVAAEDAYFADPVVRSLAAASVEVLVHPYVMGLRRAKEFLFTGERLTALEAHRIGMVNRVVPRDRLEEATLALATRVAEMPPFAAMVTKRSLNRTLDLQGFRTALSAHFETHQLTHFTEETRTVRLGGASAAIQVGRGQ
ncbi:MAG TPA: enoyl-CoA hydratase [Bryobacteraceae bacterium]|jgi:enoyl-CoA hydratase|nr:enoyl-CoA hydratase [Bryobacteraceae bacterium]